MQLLNVRTGDGNRGIIRSPQSAIALPDILGVTIETSASCEARSAPSSYPTHVLARKRSRRRTVRVPPIDLIAPSWPLVSFVPTFNLLPHKRRRSIGGCQDGVRRTLRSMMALG